MKEEDNNIVEAISKGGNNESKAIKTVLERNKLMVYNFVKRHGGSSAEAEDILIEGITEMVFNIRKGKFKAKGSLNAYLSQICRFLWYQKYRRGHIEKNREPLSEVHLSEPVFIEINAEENILDKVLDQIGLVCKQILIMWSQNYNMSDIQKEFSYGSPQVAMNKKSKCIKKLIALVNENPKLKELLKDLI